MLSIGKWKKAEIPGKDLRSVQESVDYELAEYRGETREVGGEAGHADDEVGILAKQFQHLMDRIDNLIHRELQGKLQAAQARCRMLQAQIHPHFLYNTLETIYALSERDGNREVSRITMSLLIFLKNS